jgi:hypothetical protein
MVRSGFADDTIVKMIQTNESDFDVSIDALTELKAEGVGEKIIAAMLDAAARRKALSRESEVRDSSNDGKQSLPLLFVEEVSSRQSTAEGSSDTLLETIKTLRRKGMRVTTDKTKADLILQVTRQLGKGGLKAWVKDTKIVLQDRKGNILHSGSTRSIGGAVGDVVDYIRRHYE